ncbi:expressed unknown protein [Ectocarpus siliculosus]|uniref:Uncharacterized protein n=1 Tax=Ectocarpus siliculosus TaxID=2880 RepID=D8LEF8_ECTSI|nr:expressed unknown protein [Ectocarpus siliculosus]|eukprot:CBN80201.1 expressed unknown protein [Ectocarpus siliculosus]
MELPLLHFSTWMLPPISDTPLLFRMTSFLPYIVVKEMRAHASPGTTATSFKVRQLLGDEPEKRRRSLRTKRGSSSGIPSLKKQ